LRSLHILEALKPEKHGSRRGSKHFEQKKNGSKPFRIMDFASRFVLLIKI
jgi:hypothetical protein